MINEKIKIVLIGGVVGKTFLIKQYVNKCFNEEFLEKIGEDIAIKEKEKN